MEKESKKTLEKPTKGTKIISKKLTTNPIYGKYLEFTSKNTKKKINIRDFLNELF